MALNSTATSVIESKLSSIVQDVLSEEVSLIDLLLQLPTRESSIANISSPLGPVLDVVEAGPVTDSDVSFGQVNLVEYKGGLSVSISSEWEEDSVPSAVSVVMQELAKRQQDFSDNKISALIAGNASLPSIDVASLSALSLDDIWSSVAMLRHSRDLPVVYCGHQVWSHLKSLEAAAGLFAGSESIMGLPWICSDLGAVDSSDDLLLAVGHMSREYCVSNYGVRTRVDTESSVSNALNDMINVISYNRFRIGHHGINDSLAKVMVA